MVIIFYAGLLLTGISCKGLYDYIKEKIREKEEKVSLSEKQLLVGYKTGKYKKPIIVDMDKTPHLFVSGLSQSGKTRMVENAVKNKNVILVNAFKNDFCSLRVRRVNGLPKIKEFLKDLLSNTYYREKPLYIVLDELLVLCIDTETTKLIRELLAIGRHFNIFLIGISQQGTKEAINFKDLFNARICFKQVEESSYRAVLGYTPSNKDLEPRQFHLYADKLAFGYTYDIRLNQ